MNKTPATRGRIAFLGAFVLLCATLLSYLWIDFGGSAPLAPQGYRVQVAFPQANELATGADVRIAGVNVGTVVALRPDLRESRTLATLQINSEYAPIPRDTRAILRIKTLLGETYVGLSPGDPRSGMLPDDGRIPNRQVAANVDLDQILSTFDPRTRAAFQTWMVAQAGAVSGQGENINATLGEAPGFVAAATDTLAALDAQRTDLGRLVAGTGTFFGAISARAGELQGFIRSVDSLFSTTATRNRALAAVFTALPGFERQSRLALPALTSFGDFADPEVRALDPIATELQTTFAAGATLAPQLRRLFTRLGPSVTASRRGLPGLDSLLTALPPVLTALEPWLRNVNPIVRYLGAYRPEIAGFFANVADSAQASVSANASGAGAPYLHYLRAAQTLTPSALGFFPGPTGISRDDAYRSPGIYGQLGSGLPTLDTGECSAGVPRAPTSTTPAALTQQILQYVYRTSGDGAVAAPACRLASLVPGFATAFPHVTADPLPSR